MFKQNPFNERIFLQAGVDTIVIAVPADCEWILPDIRKFKDGDVWKVYAKEDVKQGRRVSYRADLNTANKYYKTWLITIHAENEYSLMDFKTFPKRVNQVLYRLGMPVAMRRRVLCGDLGSIRRVDLAYDQGKESIVPISDQDKDTFYKKRMKRYVWADYSPDSNTDSQTVYYCTGKKRNFIPIYDATVVQCRYDKSKELFEKYRLTIPATGRIETRYQKTQTVKRNGLSSVPLITATLRSIEKERLEYYRILNHTIVIYSNTKQLSFPNIRKDHTDFKRVFCLVIAKECANYVYNYSKESLYYIFGFS